MDERISGAILGPLFLLGGQRWQEIQIEEGQPEDASDARLRVRIADRGSAEHRLYRSGSPFYSERFVVLGVATPFIPAVGVFILRPQTDN